MTTRSGGRAAVAALMVVGLVVLPGPETAAQTPPPAATGVVTGRVLGRLGSDVRPLGNALVEGVAPGYHRVAPVDASGRYRLEGVPAGSVRVRVTHVGHAPGSVEVLVPAGATVEVDLELLARPVELQALDVVASALPEPTVRDPSAEAAARLANVEMELLSSGSAMAQSGIVEAMAGLPGNDPAQATDVLFMRGSTTDLKLVLLDGAPVYTPFHVAGILRSFDPEVLGRAEMHVGGAPARYDGGLTYILDLATRDPRRDQVRAAGSVDLLSGTVALDGPLTPWAGFVASGRSLHHLATEPLGASPYGYREALASVQVTPGDGHDVKATAFWNRESVRLDLPGMVTALATPVPDDASWSNAAASARYRILGGPSTLFEATVAAGTYDATLPLQPGRDDDGSRPDPLLATAATRRVRGGLEATRVGDRGSVRFGVAAEDIGARYEARALTLRGRSVATRATAWTGGAYVDASQLLSDGVTLRAGGRIDHLSGSGGGMKIAPRASVRWEVGPTALLTVAAGRYHQHARASDAAVERAVTEDVVAEQEAPELLPVATSDHVVVALDQQLGDDVRLGIAGFWKGYQGLRRDRDAIVRNSGIDLSIRRRSEGVTTWVGYGLSWFWSATDLTGRGTDFSGRQLLSAGASGSLGERFGGEVRVAYGAGLPYSSIPFSAEGDGLLAQDAPGNEVIQEAPLAGGLDASFLRLDLEVHALLEPEWGGRVWEIRPYVRLLNALESRDALFYAFQPWRGGGLTPLAERPLVPVLGVAWRF